MAISKINLNHAWSFAHTQPNLIADANALVEHKLDWLPAKVPGTVAQSLRLADQENAFPVQKMENYDWWYSCEFLHESSSNINYVLSFEGLATLADVWLNNQLILSSQNMFVAESISVTDKLQEKNHLVICFRSATEFLQQKRPRPRWKTNLVDHQQLRWLRTSLLGHIPGWCPTGTAIGPWRDICLHAAEKVSLISANIQNLLPENFKFNAEFIIALNGIASQGFIGKLFVGDYGFDLAVDQKENSLHCVVQGQLSPKDLWWPHTHGQPHRLACRLVLTQNETHCEFDLGLRGFKQLALNREQDLVEFTVNQKPIFCRGACWTNADLESLTGTRENLEQSLLLARDAGLNMLRVGGTMVYESDDFYGLCDQLGIMVWQDFMFANMDYPFDDESFYANVSREIKSQLNRLSQYACVSVYCGNSEIQQQAAMMGQENWSQNFFDRDVKDLCNSMHPGAVYFPSTPCEGALPFSISEGISHYYGVGAYKRPLNDAVFSAVKFTPETLGFSNIPEQTTIDSILNGAVFTAHDPAWKKGVPRDSSAGWDFEDVRDFYLAQLFKVDPVYLRSHDPQKYLDLSRAVSCEVMLRTIANWRAPNHCCRGALVWFYKDLIPGAGWGLLDSNNQPKSAYYGVKRASATLAVYFQDMGLDGLALTVLNETGKTKRVSLHLKAYKNGNIETLSVSRLLELSQTATEININTWLGYFNDLNYSYGFGPKQQDVVYAYITDEETGKWIHDDTYFVSSYRLLPNSLATVEIDVVEAESTILKITTNNFLQWVHIDIDTHHCSDKYFHLAPNVTRIIKLTAKHETTKKVKGYVSAINLLNSQKFSQ